MTLRRDLLTLSLATGTVLAMALPLTPAFAQAKVHFADGGTFDRIYANAK